MNTAQVRYEGTPQSVGAVHVWSFAATYLTLGVLFLQESCTEVEGSFPADAAARSGSERFGRHTRVCGLLRLFTVSGVPEMVGHLHLQAMDDSLKGKNREGLLDSPDSGLPPSPSPPFCSLSPGLPESRSGSCTTPVESHHGYDRKESREGKLVSAYCSWV